MSSLSRRLLLSVSLLLLVFFGATIVVLDSAFREAGEQAQRDILDGQLMALLAAAEPNDAGDNLVMPPDLPEPRFGVIGSGLYGVLRGANGPVWRSRSALGLDLPLATPDVQGQQQFSLTTLADDTPLMLLSLAVTWELPGGESRPYTFHVAASLDSFHAQVAAYRRQLFSWFAAVALLMLFAISLVLRSALKPLRKIEEEIHDIESGERTALSTDFPTELTGVARNMNLLIGSERARAERYRQTLDNLAHSLKTPLAAMRAIIDEHSGAEGERLAGQVERMNDIVRYQLRKPATLVGSHIGIASIDLAAELKRLADGLAKVYHDKAPEIAVTIGDGSDFRGDRGDFLEVAGNLMDNACKWCRQRVFVAVRSATSATGKRGIELTVSDDGPGIPVVARELLLQRGTRLDENQPGHGIGLAVVKDIAAGYGGDVAIAESPAGGATLTVRLYAN